MYPNVRAEMARSNMSLRELNDYLNDHLEKPINYQLLSEKLRGNSELKLVEAIAIWEALKQPMDFLELFKMGESDD